MDIRARPLRGAMAEAARAFLRDRPAPAPPRPAATVILLRHGRRSGVEVYLLRRTTTMAFAAGMTVFPGGRVDPSDATVADSWTGPEPAWFAGRLGCTPDQAAAYVAAAVRETFEESGVLLAGPDDATVVADTTALDADRIALEAREQTFAEFLHTHGLVLRADLLGPWAHWITPEFEPRRYDTAFFVAALPEGQVTRDVSGESDQVAWMDPGEAVAAVEAGDLQMLAPTYLTCRELAGFATVADALAASHTRAIPSVMPTLRADGDDVYLETP